MKRLCRAHSSRTGAACKRQAIRGGSVCASHGGRSPQVRASAAARLSEAVDPAIRRLTSLVDRASSDTVRLNAARDILDRAGFPTSTEVQVEIRSTALLDAMPLDRLRLLRSWMQEAQAKLEGKA